MKRGTPRHPKVKRLARRLKIELFGAVGILECLWHYTAEHSPRGDIGRADDEDIADAVGWRKEPAILIQALIDEKWLDASAEHRLIVHDWPDHSEESVRRKLSRWNQTFLPVYGKDPVNDGNMKVQDPVTDEHRLPFRGQGIGIGKAVEVLEKNDEPEVAAVWKAAQFDDAEHFERWFHEFYAKHPTKGEPGFAKNYIFQAISAGNFKRTALEESYAAYLQSPAWKRDGGKIIPKLSTLCRDLFWLYPPADAKGAGPGPPPPQWDEETLREREQHRRTIATEKAAEKAAKGGA